MRDAFVQALHRLASSNPSVTLITADLGFGVLDSFAKAHPAQYLNAGVAEQNMTGIATGLALEGRVVFTYSIANFPTLRCLEQIRNDAAYHEANVNIVAIGGGFSYGALGISHHATEDLTILRSLPGITVVAPGDDWETEQAVSQLAELAGTTYLRLDRSSAGRTNRKGERFEIGVARTVREGDAMTLISTGGILGEVLVAADALHHEGIACRVVSMHTVKPLDGEAIAASARETGGILSVEEHTVDGGLGGAIAEWCMDHDVRPRRFGRIGLRAGFSSIVGSQAYLRKAYGLDSASIANTVRRMLGRDVTTSQG